MDSETGDFYPNFLSFKIKCRFTYDYSYQQSYYLLISKYYHFEEEHSETIASRRAILFSNENSNSPSSAITSDDREWLYDDWSYIKIPAGCTFEYGDAREVRHETVVNTFLHDLIILREQKDDIKILHRYQQANTLEAYWKGSEPFEHPVSFFEFHCDNNYFRTQPNNNNPGRLVPKYDLPSPCFSERPGVSRNSEQKVGV